jgi:microsomal dipeptidase-like Zn-dependent dipeptidase
MRRSVPARRSAIHIGVAIIAAITLAVTGAPAPAETQVSGSHVNAVGTPAGGLAPDGSVRGFIDAHNHLFSNEAFGGKLFCGKVFDPAGIAAALSDCADHFPNGEFAWLENIVRTGSPIGTHDPTGYPSFTDWPANDSLTHQMNYFSWMERAWRGGLRVMVSDLVTNRQLCDIYPLKDRSCDEMTSIRLQAALHTQLQTFIDTQAGGPGRGWFRLVRSAGEARDVIAQGKLAVILGVETSEPFGCRLLFEVAQCSTADIDRGLDELYALGVRSMFLCHKLDNALCGVAFDSNTLGTVLNVGNLLSTGRFWKAVTCTGPNHDNTISPEGLLPDEIARLLPPGVSLPIYPPAPHCNTVGLSALGEHALHGMMRRGMIIELDHMSVKAAERTLDLLEAAGYPGVISSHSWSDQGYLERIYRLGGMVTQYGGNGAAIVPEWQRTKPLRDRYGIVGYGVGIDANGFGQLAPPRPGNSANPVVYPFTSFDGSVTIDRLRTGTRTWDINVDGMAHYGLLPDLVEDIRKVGGDAVVNDLANGAEAYLRTLGGAEAWEPPVNLAVNRPASASSYEWWTPWLDLKPARAADGNTGTRWASHWNDNQWLQIDLGSTRTVRRVAVEWEAAFGRNYRIDVSTNGSTWSTVATVANGQGGLDALSFTPAQARYVRLQGLSRGTDNGYSIWELSVY